MAGETLADSCKVGRIAVDPEVTVTVSPEAVVVVVETDWMVDVEIEGKTTVISLVVIEVETEVTDGRVIVSVDVIVLELLAKYPTMPDKITTTIRMTNQVVCANADNLDIVSQLSR